MAVTQSYGRMLAVFGRIGLVSFGGPAAQIALMHDMLVVREKWLDERQFLRALSLCMLLPGPEAMQLATYAGWRLRGWPGGLLAGLLFVLPGAIVILVLALLYIEFGTLPLVRAAFLGIQAAVIVVVLQALWRLGHKALQDRTAWLLGGAAFLGLFVLGVPFPLIVLAAGVYGYVTAAPQDAPPPPAPPDVRTWRTVTIWACVWVAPLGVLWLIAQDFLLDMGLFFSKLAIVTFGGAYAVLAYMTQTVVQDFAWITTPQMIDALGLAETTPGPLILVTQFVALLAGFAHGGLGLALAAGATALWVTFVPCFLWIFAAAPYLDHIAARPRLSAALQRITAAVVGVILNLSVWFALHVFFDTVGSHPQLALPVPDLTTLNGAAVMLCVLAAGLMTVLRVPLLAALGLMAGFGCALSVVGFN